MNRIAAGVLAVLAVPGLSTVAEAKRETPQQRLDKLLAGRVAGEPRDCIYLPGVRSTRVIDKTAIVYEKGGVLWVNRPTSGASSLDDDDVLVTTTHSSQLCSIDIVRLHERSQGFFTGLVNLGKFVPYRRAPSQN